MNNIISNLNEVANNLFSSMENELYEILDTIITISPEILEKEPLKSIFYDSNGMSTIAFALLLFYLLYYIFNQLISLYNGNDAENIYLFIMKITFIMIIVYNNHFLIETILDLNYKLEEVILEFGKEITKNDISFVSLKDKILDIPNFLNSNLVSLDGIIKSVITFGIMSIFINFSIRYVIILILIFIFPLIITTLSMNKFKGIFYSYIKLFFCNLILGNITNIIIIIPLSYKDTNSILYRIILIGSLYIIYNLNSYIKEIFFKVSGEKNNIFEMR